MYIRCSETSLHHLSLKSLITIVEVNFKMSELCISCDKEVNGRRHAVTCDVCDRWQHRLCGTGIFIYLFIYLFILLILCLTGCSIAFVGQVSFIYLFCTNLFIYLFIYLFSLV